MQVFSVDVADHPTMADAYEIRGLPTLLLFRDGELVDRFVGTVPKSRLEAVVARRASEIVV